MLKSLFAALAVTTALGFPAAAMAKPVTFTTTLKDYGGNGAYLAFYVTDKSGAYAGSLWMAGGKSKYYKHLANWYLATGGDRAQIHRLRPVRLPAQCLGDIGQRRRRPWHMVDSQRAGHRPEDGP